MKKNEIYIRTFKNKRKVIEDTPKTMIYILRAEYPERVLGYFMRQENALAAKAYEIWRPDGVYTEDSLRITQIPSYESTFEKVPGESWVSPALINQINENTKIDLSKDLLPNNKIYDIYHEHQTKELEEMNRFQKNKEIRKAFFDQYFSDYFPKFMKEYTEHDKKYKEYTIIIEDMKTRVAQMKKQVRKKEIEQTTLDDFNAELKALTNKRGKIKAARTNSINAFQTHFKKAYFKQFSEHVSFFIDPKTDTTLEWVASSRYFDKRSCFDIAQV